MTSDSGGEEAGDEEEASSSEKQVSETETPELSVNIDKKFEELSVSTIQERSQNNLYIAGIPRHWMEDDLNEAFLKFGPIIQSRLLCDRYNSSRGVGFIRFEHKQDAENAVAKMKDYTPATCSEPITVKFAYAKSTPSTGAVEKCDVPRVPDLKVQVSPPGRGRGRGRGRNSNNFTCRATFQNTTTFDQTQPCNNGYTTFYPNTHPAAPLVQRSMIEYVPVVYWQDTQQQQQCLPAHQPLPLPHQNYQFQHHPMSHYKPAQAHTTAQPQLQQQSQSQSQYQYQFQHHPMSQYKPAQAHTTAQQQQQQQHQQQSQSQSQYQYKGAPIFDPTTMVDEHNKGCLFVFHLPSDLKNSDLFKLFKLCGNVRSAKVVTSDSHESKGYGFVNMSSYAEACFAIQCLNGFRIGKKLLKVAFKLNKTRD